MQKDNITNKQRKLMSEIKDYDFLLSILETIVIERLRKIDYGSITIVINNGVPQRTNIQTSEMLTPPSFVDK